VRPARARQGRSRRFESARRYLPIVLKSIADLRKSRNDRETVSAKVR
jgi:hypothetical protein